MTSAADGVEKACLLAFGDRAEIEEDSPALNAGNHRRVANSQGAGPTPLPSQERSGMVGRRSRPLSEWAAPARSLPR